MGIASKIKSARKALGLTQTELGAKLGVQKNAVSKWECGRVEDIPASKIKAMAELFNVTPSYLIEDEADDTYKIDNIHPIQSKRFPLLGSIACGEPILAEERIDLYVDVTTDIRADFCLRCVGDSMTNARIQDGDIVFIRAQPTVTNGEIAAVVIGDEATLKRVFYYPDKGKLVLQAENPNYEPFVYTGAELNEVRILGKAIAFQSSL